MGKFSFENEISNKKVRDDANAVNMFKLAADGDSKIVRFLHNDASDIDVIPVHPVTVKSKNGEFTADILCLHYKDEECPFCNSEYKFTKKYVLECLVYEQDDKGNFTGKYDIQIFERGPGKQGYYRDLIKRCIARATKNGEPMWNMVFEITRIGTGLDTTYTIEARPDIPDTMCPIPESLPPKTNIVGTGQIWEKTPDEMTRYISSGSFAPKKLGELDDSEIDAIVQKNVEELNYSPSIMPESPVVAPVVAMPPAPTEVPVTAPQAYDPFGENTEPAKVVTAAPTVLRRLPR